MDTEHLYTEFINFITKFINDDYYKSKEGTDDKEQFKIPKEFINFFCILIIILCCLWPFLFGLNKMQNKNIKNIIDKYNTVIYIIKTLILIYIGIFKIWFNIYDIIIDILNNEFKPEKIPKLLQWIFIYFLCYNISDDIIHTNTEANTQANSAINQVANTEANSAINQVAKAGANSAINQVANVLADTENLLSPIKLLAAIGGIVNGGTQVLNIVGPKGTAAAIATFGAGTLVYKNKELIKNTLNQSPITYLLDNADKAVKSSANKAVKSGADCMYIDDDNKNTIQFIQDQLITETYGKPTDGEHNENGLWESVFDVFKGGGPHRKT